MSRTQAVVKWLRFALLCVVSVILLYPLTVIILLPILIYRQAVKFVVRLTEPKCRDMITGISAAMTGSRPYSKPIMKLLPYILFSGTITREQFIESVKEKIIKSNLYPELRLKIIRRYGYYFWKEVDNFSVEQHVRYLNPDSPDQPVFRSELRTTYYKQIANSAFDKRLSPWQIIVVPNVVDPDNPRVKSAIIFHVHHTLMDGLSLVKFLQRFSPEPWNWALSKTMSNKKPRSSIKKKFKKSFEFFVTAPFYFVRFLLFSVDHSDFLEKAFKITKTSSWCVSDKDPLRIPAHRLKDIKENRGVGISSVLTTIATVGVSRFIQKKCKDGIAKQPKKFVLHMVLPMPGHPDTKLTNHWTMVRIPITMEDTRDPFQMAELMHRKYQELSHSIIPIVNYLAFKAIGLLPVWLHPDVTNKSKRTTLMITNFPGPRALQDFFGTPAEDWSLLGAGCTKTVFYCLIQNLCDQFWFDVGAPQTVYEQSDDPDIMQSCIKSVLKEMET